MNGAPRPDASHSDIIRAAARAFERDRYLAALLAPADIRQDLIVLAAFAGELARIPVYVNEPMIGAIRLQWWHDALDARAADQNHLTGNPLADAVAGTIERYALPLPAVHGLIDAQLALLEPQPFSDLPALQSHLQVWQTTQFELAWRVLARQPDSGPPTELLAAAGEAYGLSRMLLELPAVAAQGRTLLPASLAPHGGEHRAAVLVLADRAALRLGDIRAQGRTLTLQLRLALAPVALVEPYLRVCQGADPAQGAALDVSPLMRVWRIWRAARLGGV